MQTNLAKSDPASAFLLRLASIALVLLFLLSFVYRPLGPWLGILMGTWFIGTQKPWRGLLFVVILDLVPRLASNWGKLPLSTPAYLAWMLMATLLNVLPYFLHRLTRARLPGFFATLPLPLWGTVCQVLGQWLLPTSIFKLIGLPATQVGNPPVMQIGAAVGTSGIVFLIYWLAAIFNWMWDYDFHMAKIKKSIGLAGILFLVALGYGVFAWLSGKPLPTELSTGLGIAWVCLIAGIALVAWALVRGRKRPVRWQEKPEVVAILRSPATGAPLQVVTEGRHEVLVSQTGEKFPIRDGIPTLLPSGEMTGSNKQYNQLYETIGSFYDSSQKFMGSLFYGGVDHVFLSYLRFLEIKPGDRVLETSVGTGLNYKYLPYGVNLFGLDLSTEMLATCQANLERWGLSAELFHGNAESLPFMDNSFEVVYHAGGINFFNDKARAIREMIRVAKPGSRILIADEMEKHVRDSYERMPILGGLFKNRAEAVSVPIDLVPSEMQDVHQEIVWGGRFYVLVFRKPL